MRTVVRKYKSILFLVALATCVSGLPLVAQSATRNTQNGIEPDNWRKVPVPPNAHPDVVSPATRAARDAYWSRVEPLPKPGQGVASIPHGGGMIAGDLYTGTPATSDVIPGLPQVKPIVMHYFWVLGTFESYDVHQTSSGSIYTEIHFNIDRIIGQPTVDTPTAGSTVDVEMMGGSLLTPDGIKHEFYTNDYKYDMRPGHKYVIQLSHVSNGDVYEYRDPLMDITNEVAQPATPTDTNLARMGKWTYNGLPEADAVKHLKQQLQLCQTKGGTGCRILIN